MRKMVTKCDKCGVEIKRGSDIFLLWIKSESREDEYITHELCRKCAREIDGLVEFIKGSVKS